MWNPFKLRSNEYRQLSTQLNELSDDVTKLTELFQRIDSRIRGRARKQLADSDEQPEFVSPTRDSGGGGGADGGVRSQSPAAVAQHPSRTFSKDQLRQFARERGIMT